MSPVADVAYRMQETLGNINIDYSLLSNFRLYAAQVCINAETKYFHTEMDQGPTFIAVPFQERVRENRFNFIFRINNTKHIQLRMIPGTSFLFSGCLLTHRQECEKNGKTNFFNVASFCNKRLFDHIRQSFMRMKSK